MKISEFRGFSQVFKFTFVQTIKQKSFFVSFIIMMIFAVGMFPVMGLFNKGNGDGEAASSVEKIYVVNQTGIADLPVSEIKKDKKAYENLEVVNSTETREKLTEKISKSTENKDSMENAVVLEAKFDTEKMCFAFELFYDSKTKVSEDDANAILSDINEWFSEYKVKILGVDASLISKITSDITVNSEGYKSFVDRNKKQVISGSQYWIIYIFLMLFYMIIVMTASLVSNKIVEEKSNRIVEYLMTSVRPMALMFGKIVAMILASVGEYVCILGGGYISNTLTQKYITDASVNPLEKLIDVKSLTGFNVGTLALCVVLLILGILLYSMIAGLFGASVTKMEEVQQGMKIFSAIILIAFVASIVAANMMEITGVNVFVRFTFIFPLTSVMMLPGAILAGTVSFVEVGIALAILIVVEVIILMFVSLVYESVIVSNGSVVTFRTMIAIAKGNTSKAKSFVGGAANEEK